MNCYLPLLSHILYGSRSSRCRQAGIISIRCLVNQRFIIYARLAAAAVISGAKTISEAERNAEKEEVKKMDSFSSLTRQHLSHRPWYMGSISQLPLG